VTDDHEVCEVFPEMKAGKVTMAEAKRNVGTPSSKARPAAGREPDIRSGKVHIQATDVPGVAVLHVYCDGGLVDVFMTAAYVKQSRADLDRVLAVIEAEGSGTLSELFEKAEAKKLAMEGGEK
jgi:hypothetical protein